MIKRDFTAIYQKRGDHYIAWVEEMFGVNTQGETRRETKENLEEALLLVLEANRKVFARSHRKTILREPISVAIPAR